jgi:4-carboxymuconolactone decarboxylase
MTAPRPSSPRIEPLAELTGDAAELAGTLITGPSGRPINIFGTLAKHPKLAKRFNLFGGFLLNKGLIPVREREIVILRVGWNAQSVYEFGQHTVIGRNCGLTDTEIGALATDDPSAGNWSADDQALIALADDLCRDDCVSNETFAKLTSRWNEAEVIELIVVAGFYRLVSGFLNSVGVELDPGVPSWPA